jgi:hypothetical protein
VRYTKRERERERERDTHHLKKETRDTQVAEEEGKEIYTRS